MKIKETLLAYQDLKYKDFIQKHLRDVETHKIIGIRIPILRKLALELLKNHQNIVKSFLAEIKHYYYEEYLLHMFFIEKIDNYQELINETIKIMPYFNNYLIVDLPCNNLFKNNFQKAKNFAYKYFNHKQKYIARYSIRLLLELKDFSWATLLKIAKQNRSEYYIKMMQAWFLTESLAHDFSNLKIIKYIKNKFVYKKTLQKTLESHKINQKNKEIIKNIKKNNFLLD